MNSIGALLADPVGQMAIVPLVVALVVAALLRLSGTVGTRLAALGVGLGFFAAYYLVRGGFPFSPFPPPATAPKIFYIAAAGLVLGAAADLAGLTRIGAHVLAILLPAGALWWMRQNQIAAGADTALIATLAVLFLASVIVYWRQGAAARGADLAETSSAGLFPAIQVLAASVGLGGIALLGISLSNGSLAFALAAAAGGYLLASYLVHLFGRRALGYGATGALGAAGAWLALAYACTFEADAPIKLVLLGVVALAFAADLVARPVALAAPFGAGAFARLARPLLYGAVVGIPPAAALAYAWFVLSWRMG